MAGEIKFYTLQVFRDESEKDFSKVFGLDDKDIAKLTKKIADRANSESKDPDRLPEGESTYTNLLFSLVDKETITGSELFFLAGAGVKHFLSMAQMKAQAESLGPMAMMGMLGGGMGVPPGLMGMLGGGGSGLESLLERLKSRMKDAEDNEDEDE